VHVKINAKTNQKIQEPNEYPNLPAVGTAGILASAIQHQHPVIELVHLIDSPLQKDSKDRVKLVNLAKNFSSQIPSLES